MRRIKRRVRVQPYKKFSKSARDLSRALKAKRLNLVRTKFRQGLMDVVLNWGSTRSLGFRYINDPVVVEVAQNKLSTLRALQAAGVPVPRWTTDRSIAEKWIRKGKIALARKLLRASAGRGIVVCEPGGIPLPQAPLYTRYVPKKDEYRVHVWRGQVLHIQHKRRRRGFEHDNVRVRNQIRNYDNGWVFCQQEVVAPPPVVEASLAAVLALGLDFGAVDVGWTENTQHATVYEVNTAPGLTGTTLRKYAEAVRSVA